jgi:ACR3 family arsenite transporter
MKDAGYGSQLRMIALVAVCVRINQKACMSRDQLERYQVWLYLGAIVAGLAFGYALPAVAGPLEVLLWPVLGLLLYATFTQVPLNHLSTAFRDRRFMGAVLIGNFVAIPLLFWGLLWFAPDDPAIRLGILLVLLVPCTDWAISFTHLGGGDTARAIAAATVVIVFQSLVELFGMVAYLWLVPKLLGPHRAEGRG